MIAPKAHVAGAQQHLAIRQAQRLQHDFGAAGHALVLVVGFLGLGDADQLDFLELVLADHAARVAAMAAGLGAEAQAECAVMRSGSCASASTIASRTMLVSGTSLVGIR